ncbi:MAG: hypothetical protein AAB885_02190, partial [Patescibacteria group bacterium]
TPSTRRMKAQRNWELGIVAVKQMLQEILNPPDLSEKQQLVAELQINSRHGCIFLESLHQK